MSHREVLAYNLKMYVHLCELLINIAESSEVILGFPPQTPFIYPTVSMSSLEILIQCYKNSRMKFDVIKGNKVIIHVFMIHGSD